MTAKEFRKLIDNIYFGIEQTNTKVDYLQDDIDKAFRSLVKYYTVSEILSDTSETKIIGKEELRFANWKHTEAIIEIYKSIEMEYIVRLRTLLAKERYAGKKTKKVKSLEECEIGSQTGGSLVKDLKKYCSLDKRKRKLKSLIAQFEEKDYYERIIVENQKILLHKDSEPEKRQISKIIKDEYRTITYYKSRANLDRDTIIGALEDLSQIIICYLGNTIDTIRTTNMQDTRDYIRKLVCALYSEKKSEIISKKLTKSIKQCLRNTVEIIRWQ